MYVNPGKIVRLDIPGYYRIETIEKWHWPYFVHWIQLNWTVPLSWPQNFSGKNRRTLKIQWNESKIEIVWITRTNDLMSECLNAIIAFSFHGKKSFRFDFNDWTVPFIENESRNINGNTLDLQFHPHQWIVISSVIPNVKNVHTEPTNTARETLSSELWANTKQKLGFWMSAWTRKSSENQPENPPNAKLFDLHSIFVSIEIITRFFIQ